MRASSSGKPDPNQLERRLKAKLQRVQKGVEKQSQAGQPPFEVVELMNTFTPFMQKGRHAEADGGSQQGYQAA